MLHTIQNDALTVSRDGAQYLQQPCRVIARTWESAGAFEQAVLIKSIYDIRRQSSINA